MTNPFPKEIHAIVQTGTDDSWVLDYPQFSMERRNWTKAQAEYTAKAINKYKKIMTMLKELEWEGGEDWDEVDGHAIPTCPCCGGRHVGYGKGFHDPECELAALLSEENPNK